MGEMTCILVYPTLVIGLNAVIKVFKEVNIRNLENSNLYDNTLSSCHLVVKKVNICKDC
jgi:hypothetical protein